MARESDGTTALHPGTVRGAPHRFGSGIATQPRLLSADEKAARGVVSRDQGTDMYGPCQVPKAVLRGLTRRRFPILCIGRERGTCVLTTNAKPAFFDGRQQQDAWACTFRPTYLLNLFMTCPLNGGSEPRSNRPQA